MSLGSTSNLPHAIPIRSVKLAQEELDRLMDDMERGTKAPKHQLRRHKRINCRCTGMIVTADQNGFQSTFIIPVRNISRGGVGFLHRAMIHTGSPCDVRIRTPLKLWINARGKVVRSRYVKASIYEIGLQFEEEIDASLFEEPASLAPPEEQAQRP